MTTQSGTVINIHHHGATVRLEDGTLATVPLAELTAHRPAYVSSLEGRRALPLALDRHGRHRVAMLLRETPAIEEAPPNDAGRLAAEAFEAHMGAYLKATLEWAPADRPPPAQRHFIRKKRRARLFEARSDGT